MSRSDTDPAVAEGRANYFALLIANRALSSASTPELADDGLARAVRAALASDARPVVVVLPARGGPSPRFLDGLDVWILRDDGSSTVDAAIRAAGEAFDEIPRRFTGGVLVLASSSSQEPQDLAHLMAAASRSTDGIACQQSHWPIAASQDALVEMALRGFERTLRMRVTVDAHDLVDESRSGEACSGAGQDDDSPS